MMNERFICAGLRRIIIAAFLILPGILSSSAVAETRPPLPPLPEVFSKEIPETVQDLRDIQERTQKVIKRVEPAIVNVRIGPGQGSGIIVSEDGLILTAGHVSGPPGRNVLITFPDGKRVRGKTLGRNRRVDAGMIKITQEGKWPHVEMGNSKDLERGTWVVAIGHPGGFRKGRTPVVRLGRVQDNLRTLIRTDCTLVGGDSGGPLFNMNGKLVGIHSRIGPSITYNIHVPVDIYKSDWEDLVASVDIGSTKPWIGVQGDPDSDKCKILKVVPNSPADKAGIKADDIVTKFAGKKIESFYDLAAAASRQRPGNMVNLEVLRDGEKTTLKLKVGKRES